MLFTGTYLIVTNVSCSRPFWLELKPKPAPVKKGSCSTAHSTGTGIFKCKSEFTWGRTGIWVRNNKTFFARKRIR